MDKHRRGELLNALTAAAYAGRIDRRTFLDALLKAGVTAGVAMAWADGAAAAAEPDFGATPHPRGRRPARTAGRQNRRFRPCRVSARTGRDPYDGA